MLERTLGLTRIDPDDVMTVVFTSGSTGRPKGVMLTYHNVGANVRGFSQVLRLGRKDALLGILPFFHSFGYTGILWSVLTLDPKGAYHHNPLEARQIGKLAGKYGVTILISAPTLLAFLHQAVCTRGLCRPGCSRHGRGEVAVRHGRRLREEIRHPAPGGLRHYGTLTRRLGKHPSFPRGQRVPAGIAGGHRGPDDSRRVGQSGRPRTRGKTSESTSRECC